MNQVTEQEFRETTEITVEIPALPRPTLEELQEKFPWIKSIRRDSSPTEVVTLKLGYERRLVSSPNMVLGYQQAVWLIEYQDKIFSLTALLMRNYVDFSGLAVVDELGDLSVLCLRNDNGRWGLYWL